MSLNLVSYYQDKPVLKRSGANNVISLGAVNWFFQGLKSRDLVDVLMA